MLQWIWVRVLLVSKMAISGEMTHFEAEKVRSNRLHPLILLRKHREREVVLAFQLTREIT